MTTYKYSRLATSAGTAGWYTTVSIDEKITLPDKVKALNIQTQTALSLVLNEDPTYTWYLDTNVEKSIEGLAVKTITVKGAAGQKIKWEALLSV